MAKRGKLTQKELVFYMLWKSYKQDPEKYLEVWRFIGEVYVEEVRQHGFMSYICVHRTFEVFDTNPGLVERIKVTGKSGSKFYAYRLSKNATSKTIVDQDIQAFYKKIKAYHAKPDTPARD